MKPIKIKRISGFTLVELMITVAIAMILITLAIPSFSLMINNAKVTSLTNEFVAALNLARSEALKRSNTVTVCRSNADFTACSTADAKDYAANGWLVFPDCDTAGQGTLGVVDAAIDCDADGTNENEAIIKVGESNEFINLTSTVDFITYDLAGRIKGAAPEFSVKHTTSGTNTNIKQNKITINRIGRVKSEKI